MEAGAPSATARAVAQVRAAMDRPVTPDGDAEVEQRIVERIGEALAGAGHDTASPTLFLVEGLLIYLEVDVIERLLRALRQRSSAESRLAVSISRNQSPAFYARVASVGEKAQSTFDEHEARALLQRCGWDGDTSRAVVLAAPIAA